MSTKQDWEWLAFNSHYRTAQEVQKFLREGKSVEASDGLDALIEAMTRTEKRALTSQLTRLMAHIIKWKCQPERRSASWSITIRSARQEIEEIQEDVPSLNQNYIESVWDKCFKRAVKDAEDEMGKDCELTSLSRPDVFEEEYILLKGNNNAN